MPAVSPSVISMTWAVLADGFALAHPGANPRLDD
jgi:hypothetical protein